MAFSENKTVNLYLDTSSFDKSLLQASEKYKNFIENSEKTVGFNATNKALNELLKAVSNLAELESWSIEEKIKGYEKISNLYENNASMQIALENKVHSLKKQFLDEEFNLQMRNVEALNKKDKLSTDYSALINSYEELKEVYSSDLEKTKEIDEKIEQASEDRKEKLVKIKEEEINSIISLNDRLMAENERNFNVNKPFNDGNNDYYISYYNKQIDLNKELIDSLTQSEKQLTSTQKNELEKRKDLEANYLASINKLVYESVKAKEEAEKEITEIVKKASEEREALEKSYSEKSASIEKEAITQKKDLQIDYDLQLIAINDKKASEEERITANYLTQLEKRENAYKNYFNLFDKVNSKEVSGDTLLENLKGQLDAIKNFENGLDELRKKGFDLDLISSISDMGASKYAEVAALNTLSEDQIKEYSDLYRQKTQDAKLKAQASMVDERQKMSLELSRVAESASLAINALNNSYNEKMQSIEINTKNSLEKLQKDWEETHKEIEAKASEELKKQEEIIEKSIIATKESYDADKKNFLSKEKEKTDSANKENIRRENEVAISLSRNADALASYIPVWESIGIDMGNALLRGISGTKDAIVTYLNQVAASVRNAQKGEDAEVSDPSYTASGTYQRASLMVRSSSAPIASKSEKGFDYNLLADIISTKQEKVFHYNPVYNSPKAMSASEQMALDRINMQKLSLNFSK